MTTADQTLVQLAKDVSTDGGLKVWSVIVTLLGDRVRHDMDPLPSKDLMAVLGLLGISPESIRVALHRLRRDGWIVAHKSGRTSSYSLTPKAQEETLAVAPQIYEARLVAPATLSLCVFRDAGPAMAWVEQISSRNVLWLHDMAIVTFEDRVPHTQDAICFPVQAQTLPEWIRSRADRALDTQRIQDVLDVMCALGRLDLTENDEKRAARLLALHAWRRVILKTNFAAFALSEGAEIYQKSQGKLEQILKSFPV